MAACMCLFAACAAPVDAPTPPPAAVRILDLDAAPAPTPPLADRQPAVVPQPAAPVAEPASDRSAPTARPPDPAALRSTATPASPAAGSPSAKPPTPLAACRNTAEFVAHLSLGPNSALLAGQGYAKMWRIRNTGGCTWHAGDLLLRALDPPANAAPVSITASIAPGASLDLRAPLTAPPTAGSFTLRWLLLDRRGEPLLLAGAEDSLLTAQITVRLAPTESLDPPLDDCI